MNSIRMREHVVRQCSEEVPPGQWRPKAMVFWNEGNKTHQQELLAPEGRTFKTKAEADEYALYNLASPWIDSR